MDDENDDFKRDPREWETGSEPMTYAQRIELELLSRQTGEPAQSDGLTKAQASEEIARLRQTAEEESKLGVKEDETDTVLGDDK